MTKMKRYPRFLALLATLALLLNSVPLILQAAADNAAMTLRVLEDFTGLVPGGEVGSLTVDGVCGCSSWKKITTAVIGIGRTKTTID